MTNFSISGFPNLDFGHLGWKYYNSIKKKAMEQEFSWSGLILSLSIAFFIVIACAYALSFFYSSIDFYTPNKDNLRIYRLETSESFLIQEYLGKDKIQVISSASLA